MKPWPEESIGHVKSSMNMSVYAYIRVSTQLQTHESQKYEITRWCASRGIEIDTWVTESVSGTVAWEKRCLGRVIRRMKSGDMIVCTELSRLGRNLLMIMSILNTCSQKGVVIRSIKDNFELSDSLNSKIIAGHLQSSVGGYPKIVHSLNMKKGRSDTPLS